METTTGYLGAPYLKQGRMWVREQRDRALGPFARRLFLPPPNSPILLGRPPRLPRPARSEIWQVIRRPGSRRGKEGWDGGVTPGTTLRELGVGESREALRIFGG